MCGFIHNIEWMRAYSRKNKRKQHKKDVRRNYFRVYKEIKLRAKQGMNDVIIKCYAGTTSAACAAIDSLFSDMFVGTLAGDDTILLVTYDYAKAVEVAGRLKRQLATS